MDIICEYPLSVRCTRWRDGGKEVYKYDIRLRFVKSLVPFGTCDLWNLYSSNGGLPMTMRPPPSRGGLAARIK